MEVTDVLVRLVAGGIIGFTIGLTGVGGGVLVLPTLVSVFGLPPTVAVGTASLYTFLTKIYATVEHFRKKTIQAKIGFLFLAGAIPGTVAASIAINRIVDRFDAQAVEKLQTSLKWLMITVMAVSAILVLINTIAKKKPVADQAAKKSGSQVIPGILLGLLVGALLGATSIGGGVLVIPILILFFQLTASRTVGTSIFIAVILSLITAVIYGKGGQIDLKTGILMFAGSTVGVYFGAKTCARASEKVLKVVLVSIIVFSIGMMLVGSAGH